MLALIHREPARRSIFATDNTEFIVDCDDYEMCARHKWFTKRNVNTLYAKANIRDDSGRRYFTGLHTIVLGQPLGSGMRHGVGHHVDGNGQHNWRSNLELVSQRLNALLAQLSTANTSGFAGVHWDKQSKKWKAFVSTRQGLKTLGRYVYKEDAIRARMAALAQEIAIERARIACGLFT